MVFQQLMLPAAARRWGADVVHSPAFIMPVYRGSQRHVLTVHDMTSFSLPQHHIFLRRNAFYKTMMRVSIRRAQVVVAPSDATKRRILELMPSLPASHIRAIRWGVGQEFKVYPEDKVQERAHRL